MHALPARDWCTIDMALAARGRWQRRAAIGARSQL